MKMKYIIIPTIVFNLVCLSIFISRQYKKYHTRKSNYIHYIEISETIKSEFPNYTKNKYIIFFSNDIENRLRKNFLGKQITTSLKKEKIPLSKYTTPLLFTIDSNNTVQNIFIPDKDDTESLRNYLKK